MKFNSVLFTKSWRVERLCVPIVNCGLCGFENIIQGKINIHQVGETLVKCFAPSQIKCAHSAVWRIVCLDVRNKKNILNCAQILNCLCVQILRSVCAHSMCLAIEDSMCLAIVDKVNSAWNMELSLRFMDWYFDTRSPERPHLKPSQAKQSVFSRDIYIFSTSHNKSIFLLDKLKI